MSKQAVFGFFGFLERNLKNRPWRNLAAALAFAIIAGTVFSAQFLMSGASESLKNGIDRMGADIMVVPTEYSAASESVLLTGQPTSFFFRDNGFQQIEKIPGVAKASPEIFIGTLYGQSCCAGAVQLVAIDPENDFTISTWLEENPGIKMGKDDIIVGSAIIGDTGSELLFYGHPFHIAGRLEPTGLQGVDMAVFTRFEDAYTMADESGTRAVRKLTIPPGMASAVLVRVEPGTSPDAVSDAIRKSVPGTRTITPDGLLNTVSGELGGITSILYGSSLAVTAVSVPLLGFISAMVAHERRKEIAILRALGATKIFILRLMLAESFTISIMGALAGVGIAALLILTFKDFVSFTLKIPFVAPSLMATAVAAGSALVLAVMIGGVAALYPALRVSRSEPYETMRKG